MKHKIIIILTLIALSFGGYAQNCEAYIPTKIGEKHMYVTKDKKDKIQSYYSQELLVKRTENGGTVFEILRISYDDKKAVTSMDTLKFTCKDNMFYIDMSSYLNKQQLSAYDESQIEMTFENLGYPANLKPGMTLKPGYVQADINVGITISFKTDITNRIAVAYEDITTGAGTFKTIKVTEDIESKIAFGSFSLKSVSWVIMNIGNIRTESYDKKGNLISVSELISIQ